MRFGEAPATQPLRLRAASVFRAIFVAVCFSDRLLSIDETQCSNVFLTCFSFFCVLRRVVVDELRRTFRLVGMRFSVFGYQLSAIGYRRSAIGGRLSAIGYRLSVVGGRLSVIAVQIITTTFTGSSLPSTSEFAQYCHPFAVGVSWSRLTPRTSLAHALAARSERTIV